MSARKQIAVIVATDAPARAREALRAAVGLTLRGDAVRVVLAAEPAADDPDIQRALRVLGELGLSVARGPAAAVAREADAVEVWT
jgi:hypothetical protein